MAFKIAKKRFPSEDINSLFKPTPQNLNTRSNRAYHTEFKRHNYAYYSVIPRLRRTWNDLPKNISDLNDLDEFKKYARAIYLSYYQPPRVSAFHL